MPSDNEKFSLPPDLFARNTVISYLAGKICKKAKPGILDVGGYNGKLAGFFGECSKYVILDRKQKPESETCEYKQADARKIPFSDRNFDIVIASDFLEHVKGDDRPKVIKEMLRVSKNHLILGAPLKSRLVQTAEEQIKSQFFANAGEEHPFLIEHEATGLPDEDVLDAILSAEGVKFMKVREGNLMNWYLQQLYTGTHHGENGNFDKFGFYTFYNQHLGELGNLRPPTYRTIYVIAREGELPENEIYTELQAKFTWNTETFMQLMRIAFDDLRFVIDRKKEILSSLESELNQKETALSQMAGELETVTTERETVLQKAKKAIDAYREAVTELRNFLQEKEQALIFLKNILHEKDRLIGELEKKYRDQLEVIKGLNSELAGSREKEGKMREHVLRTEKNLQETGQSLSSARGDLRTVNEQLASHARTLNEIFSSRAWKATMAYSKVKMGLVVNPARAIKKGWKIFSILGPKVFMQRLQRKIKRGAGAGGGKGAWVKGGAGGGADTRANGYDRYILENKLSAGDIKDLRRRAAAFAWKPQISIVMPVYNVNENWLKRAVETVKAQVYDKWELCICDDASTQPHIKPLLEKFAREDKRIKVIYRQKNGGIVKASNDALSLASGAYIGLLDDDDELAPEALYEVVKALQEKKYDLIYSDEDKIGTDGRRYEPFFKPGWSPDLLWSCNYISHFGVYKRKIIEDIGGFREGYDGSQDYDLVLRFVEKAKEIKHIPKVLYHWRAVKGSAAVSIDAKPYAFTAAKKALTDAAKRRGISGEVMDGLWTGSYRLKRHIESEPLVSIIIPFKDRKDLLERCLSSINEKTTWPRYEILLVNNGSELMETADYLLGLTADNAGTPAGRPLIRIIDYDKPFNYAAINNYAVSQAQGDYLLFLNNDTEVISPDWIQSLLEHAHRKEVGAVGAKLLFADGTIQHAGVVLGLGGLAGHAFSRLSPDIEHGYFGMTDIVRNYAAVTGACLMVRKEVFAEAGGFDEKNLSVGFNDVDFCLKLIEKGYLNVYTPYAVLHHFECSSRGYDIDLREVGFMQRKYAGLLKKGDPYYNPNLTLERGDFSLRCLDKVPR